MKLWELVGKKVKLVLNNDKIVEGEITDWNDSHTSVSGEDEIIIGSKIYAESDYKTIELIN